MVQRQRASANKLNFEYAIDINAGTCTATSAFDLITLLSSVSAGTVDGNAATNSTAISGTTFGLRWGVRTGSRAALD